SKLRVAMMVGDKDKVVDGVGARVVLARLELADFPASRIKLMIIRATRTFKATHVSVLGASPAAKAEIWQPADRLIDSVRQTQTPVSDRSGCRPRFVPTLQGLQPRACCA